MRKSGVAAVPRFSAAFAVLAGCAAALFFWRAQLSVGATAHATPATGVSPYENYYGLWFSNDHTGWVVGTHGAILHTRDAGKTWAAQASSTNEPLFDVQSVDGRAAWVVGKAGTILHTGDGGATWARQESGTDSLLSQLHFVDARRGWVVGEWGTILHTADGGAAWRPQREEQDVIFNGVCFVDAEHGWVVGERGTILHTADGGATWTRQGEQVEFELVERNTGTTLRFTDLTLYRVRFLDLQRGWIAGIDGTLFRTTDGGQSWAAIGRPVERSLFDVWVDPSGRGWAVGLEGGYVRSEDGGRSWGRVLPSPIPTSFWLYRVQFVNARTGWIVGARGTVLHSGDGGATWNAQG